MSRARDALFLTGRLALGAFFLQNAFNHFTNTRQMAAYARSHGVKTPYVAVLGTGTLLAIGGASILTGRRPKVGLAATTLFFSAVTPKMHRFWEEEDDTARMNEMVNFTKNIALGSAIVALAAVEEPWPLSLGAKADVRAEVRDLGVREKDLETAIEEGHS